MFACCHVGDYDKNVIKKHELTRKDKEDDRTRHMLTIGAHAGPVFIAYRPQARLTQLVVAAQKAAPLYDFTASDGVRHVVWRATDPTPFVEGFAAVEAAYIQHPDEIGPLLNVLLAELKKLGLEALDLEGQPFDPEVADAVAHEPSEGDEVLVTEVLRSGYSWRGKTLRPAMVRTKG